MKVVVTDRRVNCLNQPENENQLNVIKIDLNEALQNNCV